LSEVCRFSSQSFHTLILSNSSSGWCLLVERSNCWEARQQIWPQGGLHLWGNCCQVWTRFDFKIWFAKSQLWPSCLFVRTLPHYGLLKLWPRHRLWVWSNVSLVNTQRNLLICSLIFWLCRYLPSVVGVAPFFTDNRALAIGICLCGSGVGRKTFPSAILNSSFQGWHFWPCARVKFYSSRVSWLVIFHHCIVDFVDICRHGWRWVMRMFAGLCLLCTFCGALMATG